MIRETAEAVEMAEATMVIDRRLPGEHCAPTPHSKSAALFMLLF